MNTLLFRFFLLIGFSSLFFACRPNQDSDPKPPITTYNLPELNWPPEIVGWTYEKLNDSFPYSRKIHFFNENQGYRSTGGLITNDGGFSWDRIPFEATSEIINSYFWSPNHGIVVYKASGNYKPSIAISEDAGMSWTTQSTLGLSENITSLWFGDAKHGLAVSKRYLYSTQDSGKVWTSVLDIQLSVDIIQAIDSQNVMVISQDSLYYSDDSGKNWQAIISLPYIETVAPITPDFQAYSLDSLYYQTGGIYHQSADGGQSWEVLGEYEAFTLIQGTECFSYGKTGRYEIHQASNRSFDDVAYIYKTIYHKSAPNLPWIEGSKDIANQYIGHLVPAGPNIVVASASTKEGQILVRYKRN